MDACRFVYVRYFLDRQKSTVFLLHLFLFPHCHGCDILQCKKKSSLRYELNSILNSATCYRLATTITLQFGHDDSLPQWQDDRALVHNCAIPILAIPPLTTLHSSLFISIPLLLVAWSTVKRLRDGGALVSSSSGASSSRTSDTVGTVSAVSISAVLVAIEVSNLSILFRRHSSDHRLRTRTGSMCKLAPKGRWRWRIRR